MRKYLSEFRRYFRKCWNFSGTGGDGSGVHSEKCFRSFAGQDGVSAQQTRTPGLGARRRVARRHGPRGTNTARNGGVSAAEPPGHPGHTEGAARGQKNVSQRPKAPDPAGRAALLEGSISNLTLIFQPNNQTL